MSVETTIIQLTTPALDSRKNPDTLTKPQAVRKWVDNLPHANPPNMAREVLFSLKLLNRHPAKVSQRAKIMMIYLDPFRRIIDMARRISCQGRSGRNNSNEELITLAEAICSEMAYGFKYIINSELGLNTKVTPEKRAEYIYLTITCLSFSLILNMAAYRPESRTAWREIYQLLTRAQQLGIANHKIPNAATERDHEVTALNSFKTILLTSILDPSRLTPREIWGAHDYLSWYGKNARLTSVEQASKHSGNYLISIDGMQKPSLFDPEKNLPTPGQHMVLETHGLNIQISKHLDILLDDNSAPVNGSEQLNPTIKIHLLRQMLHIWHNNPKRRYERTEKFDRVSCAFGVSSVYSFLDSGTMRKLYHESDSYGNINPPKPELSDIIDTYECRQENLSTNGMMLLSSNQKIAKLKIGQIVVTESLIGEGAQPLNIGVVRRITSRDQSTTEFGIQFIPGKMFAAIVMPEAYDSKHETDPQPCVVLELGRNQPKALITTNLLYQTDRRYVLDIKDGNTNWVIAGALLESTACFDCFEYNVLEQC